VPDAILVVLSGTSHIRSLSKFKIKHGKLFSAIMEGIAAAKRQI